MLKITKLINTPSVNSLVKLWAERYIPDFSILCLNESHLNISELIAVASAEGREKTALKAKTLLRLRCGYAATETNTLFSYIPNVINLSETEQLSQFTQQVYQQAIEIYKQQSLPVAELSEILQVANTSASLETIDLFSNAFKEWSQKLLGLPAVEQLAIALETSLMQLQNQHLLVKDQRAIGFLSTHFYFSTKLILNRFTLPEQVLLSPYFKFVEEQVSIPWQRVCAAATKHNFNSSTLAIVHQMLPASYEIASDIHRRASHLNPSHCSRRGRLKDPGVRASSIRDLEMFQAFLWLCVLEDSMASVEKELLPLSVMVFPALKVRWELVEQIMPLLAAELWTRLEPEQMQI
ncbi:MAG: hypothetical protein F6J89_31345, partial [Symploca sp. SIO1C4]|nr:hypothetical protein [Symploca sp. SIO1C4]